MTGAGRRAVLVVAYAALMIGAFVAFGHGHMLLCCGLALIAFAVSLRLR